MRRRFAQRFHHGIHRIVSLRLVAHRRQRGAQAGNFRRRAMPHRAVDVPHIRRSHAVALVFQQQAGSLKYRLQRHQAQHLPHLRPLCPIAATACVAVCSHCHALLHRRHRIRRAQQRIKTAFRAAHICRVHRAIRANRGSLKQSRLHHAVHLAPQPFTACAIARAAALVPA